MKSKILACLILVSLVFFGCIQGSGTKDCKEDMSCFKKEAESCKPAKVNFVESIDSAGYGITYKYYFEIKGKEGDKCSLYIKFEDIDMEYPPEATAEEKQQAEAIFAMFKGLDGICKFESTSGLTTALTSFDDTTFQINEVAECTGKLFEFGVE